MRIRINFHDYNQKVISKVNKETGKKKRTERNKINMRLWYGEVVILCYFR